MIQFIFQIEKVFFFVSNVMTNSSDKEDANKLVEEYKRLLSLCKSLLTGQVF